MPKVSKRVPIGVALYLIGNLLLAGDATSAPRKHVANSTKKLSVAIFQSSPSDALKKSSRAAKLSERCPFEKQPTDIKTQDFVDGLVLSLAGNVVDSLMDGLAMKFQPESTVLESVIPLDGIFKGESFAYSSGCLVFHNGDDSAAGQSASLEAAYGISGSPDGTAFHFVVWHWSFAEFLKPKTSAWGQVSSARDIALKIEFLSPSADGVGRRAVFVEHDFRDIGPDDLAGLFRINQRSPWVALPTNAAEKKQELHQPVNLRVTIVESTRQGAFAKWAHQAALDSKAAVSASIQEELRKSLDSSYAASESVKASEAAAKAYGEYSSARSGLEELRGKEPSGGSQAQHDAWKAQVLVAEQVVESRRILAKHAFAAADLQWPEVP